MQHGGRDASTVTRVRRGEGDATILVLSGRECLLFHRHGDRALEGAGMTMGHEDKGRPICEECAVKGGCWIIEGSTYEWYSLSKIHPCYVCGSTKGRCAQLFCFEVKER